MVTSLFMTRVRAVGMAAALALTLSCGGSKTAPTASENPSTASSLLGPTAVLAIRSSASPALVATGVAVTFDASLSIGSDLKYQIDFGDGESSNKPIDTHVAKSAGAKTARVTVTDAAGRTSALDVPYFVAALEGLQPAFWQASVSAPAALLLANDGGQVTGQYNDGASAPTKRALSGTLRAPGTLDLATSDGAVRLEGTLTWKAGSAPTCMAEACVALRLTTTGGANAGHTSEFVNVPLGAAPVARLTIPSEVQPALALARHTALAFDASASAGPGLTYNLAFGDGVATNKAIETRVFTTAGARTATLTITDLAGRTSSVTANYSVIAIDEGFSARWSVRSAPGGGSVGPILFLSNQSSVVSGEYLTSGIGYRPLSGTLSGQRSITLRDAQGAIALEGQFEWKPDRSATCVSSPYCIQLRASAPGFLADALTRIYLFADSL